ncbi:MAG: apolipoprotein N-acyltransferase [Bacteroidales bacterium]|nr:apolipoprotein N-acyltransferase [Bacteroidales bacterium]
MGSKNGRWLFPVLTALFAVLSSVPFLVPGCGWMMLFAFVPLLLMDREATARGISHFWLWHYSAFLLWNAITTFWVCNATVGGGIFACLANALQMSLVFGLYRLVKKRFCGASKGAALPYIFLAAAWIAWEKWYLVSAQISWPWLVLGNAFARTLPLAQFYEYTGTLGGSLWVWASNLSIFGILSAPWKAYKPKRKTAVLAGVALAIWGPAVWSLCLWGARAGADEPGRTLDIIAFQPNIDPYNKFSALTQQQQNAILEDQMRVAIRGQASSPVLLLAPETFTYDIVPEDVGASVTYRRFVGFLKEHPEANLLFGSSTRTYLPAGPRPSQTARPMYDGRWMETHNSAVLIDSSGRADIYHKSKLVVGVEMMPYPGFFRHIDEWLGGVMGRDIGQDSVSLLHFRVGSTDVPIGCAICYESVYGEHCAEYVRAGAELLTVITNDAWWGDTPGYRQHLSYASLRAIETRRWIARSANTGISAFIDPRGRIVASTPWWEKASLPGTVVLSTARTFFVRVGDIPGRLSILVFLLLLVAAMVSRRR